MCKNCPPTTSTKTLSVPVTTCVPCSSGHDKLIWGVLIPDNGTAAALRLLNASSTPHLKKMILCHVLQLTFCVSAFKNRPLLFFHFDVMPLPPFNLDMSSKWLKWCEVHNRWKRTFTHESRKCLSSHLSAVSQWRFSDQNFLEKNKNLSSLMSCWCWFPINGCCSHQKVTK